MKTERRESNGTLFVAIKLLATSAIVPTKLLWCQLVERNRFPSSKVAGVDVGKAVRNCCVCGFIIYVSAALMQKEARTCIFIPASGHVTHRFYLPSIIWFPLYAVEEWGSFLRTHQLSWLYWTLVCGAFSLAPCLAFGETWQCLNSFFPCCQ